MRDRWVTDESINGPGEGKKETEKTRRASVSVPKLFFLLVFLSKNWSSPVHVCRALCHPENLNSSPVRSLQVR